MQNYHWFIVVLPAVCCKCSLGAGWADAGWAVSSLCIVQLYGLSSALFFSYSTQVNVKEMPFLGKNEEDVEGSTVLLKVRMLFCSNTADV